MYHCYLLHFVSFDMDALFPYVFPLFALFSGLMPTCNPSRNPNIIGTFDTFRCVLNSCNVQTLCATPKLSERSIYFPYILYVWNVGNMHFKRMKKVAWGCTLWLHIFNVLYVLHIPLSRQHGFTFEVSNAGFGSNGYGNV